MKVPVPGSKPSTWWTALLLAALFCMTPGWGCKAPEGQACLRVGAFNVKAFGSAKMSDESVAPLIVKVASRYDLLVLQEIRDASQAAQKKLLRLLNEAGGNYSMVLSERLGRSSYTEQYGFYYRQDRVSAVKKFQYDDGPDDYTDPFEREPFAVLFQVSQPNDLTYEFGVVALHSKPEDAVSEIKLLDTVAREAMAAFQTNNMLIMGDLNADCSYSDDSQLAGSAIFSPPYTWLIPSTADTTVKETTDCAYDRIIATSGMLDVVAEGTAQPFRFDVALDLTEDMAYSVSDHYPVEVELHIPL